MSKLFLIMIFPILSILNCNAQFYSGGVSYLPNPATTNDSIFVYDTLTIRASIILTRQVNVVIRNDSIYINETFNNNCVNIEDAEIYRVTNIGKLAKGIYHVIVYASYRNFICNVGDTFLNQLSFELNVIDPPNSIDEILNLTASNLPTIFQNFIQLKSINPKSTIDVYDVQGRCYFSSASLNNLYSINTSDWANGVYFICVESNGERKRWKTLKE